MVNVGIFEVLADASVVRNVMLVMRLVSDCMACCSKEVVSQ